MIGKVSNEIKRINTTKKTNTAYNYGNSIKEPSYFINEKK